MSGDQASHIKLVCDWSCQIPSGEIRRNSTGFSRIKLLMADADDDNPVTMNAFLFAFLATAKNFDLYLQADYSGINADINELSRKLDTLELFEREGDAPQDQKLVNLYLKSRHIACRTSARDEQRTLATLLFSGPSKLQQIEQDLKLKPDLAKRVLRALGPLVSRTEENPEQYALRSDTDSLAVALYLLRYSLGIDPLNYLRMQLTHNG